MKKILKTAAMLLTAMLLGSAVCAPAYAAKAAYKLGDVNADGEIDMKDAMMTVREYMYVETLYLPGILNEEQKPRADINGDGSIDMKDAQFILCYADRKSLYPEETWKTFIDSNKYVSWNDFEVANCGEYKLAFDETIGDFVLTK
jgi:hypothetical protein